MGETMDARVAAQMYCDAETVRRFIAEYVGVDLKDVTDETHLTDDLGLDWLDQLELMVLIEDEFGGVEFFANTTAHVELVGDLIRQVEQRNAAPITTLVCLLSLEIRMSRMCCEGQPTRQQKDRRNRE
jgi:acyl carrier protein